MGRAIVVGAGMGGLSAVLALRHVGIQALVIERAAEMREVGAGIQIWANGMRAMQQVGLAEAVHELATPTEVQEFRSWKGKTLIRISVGDLARKAGTPPPVIVRRADLLRLLAEAVGAGVVLTGAECQRFEQDATGVTVHLADGRKERAEVLIGADGINSAVRTQLLPDAKPRFAGYQYLRALSKFEHPACPPGHFCMTFGPGDRFGVQNLGDGWMYWFAVIVNPPGAGDAGEGHTFGGATTARREELIERYRDFVAPIPEIIAATPEEAIGRADIRDLPPLERWGEGRVTLLGDAAHATTPNLGRGAGEAMEDAVVLASCLASTDGLENAQKVTSALRAYEARRRTATAEVQNRAWRIGRLASWKNPLAWRLREFVMKRIASKGMLKNFEAEFAAPAITLK